MSLLALVEDSLSQIAKQLSLAPDNKYVENITSAFDASFRSVRPEDSHRHAHAYKELAYILSNKVASALAKVPFDLFVIKTSNGKLANKTIPVSKERLAYLKKNHNHAIAKAAEIEQVIESPILDLFTNVNPFFNSYDFMELTSINMDIMGNAYWYVVKNGMGTPVELWLIPAQYMWVVADKKEYIKGYLMQRPGTGGQLNQVPFTPDEIIHFKYPSVNSLYYGISPLGAVSESYNLQININRYDVSFFSNMTRPDGVLKTTGTVEPSVFEKVRRQFKQRNSGVMKARTPLILEGGLEWQQTSLNPDQLGLKDARREVLEKMAMAWNVPLGLLITENVNKANAEAAETQFLRDGIQPRLIRLEQKINERLMPMFAPNLFIAFENPIPDDREFRLKERNENISTGYSTVNEERMKDGVEDHPEGDVLRQPVTAVAPASPKRFGPIKVNLPASHEARLNADMNELATKINERIKEHKPRSKEDRDAYYKVFESLTDPLEVKFRKELVKYFKKQEKAVKANLKKIKGAHMNRTRSSLIKVDSNDINNIVFANTKWQEEYIEMLEEEYVLILGAAGANAETIIPGLSFEVKNPLAEKYIGDRLPLVADDINDTTIKKLKKTLRKGISEGESVPKLATRVELVYEEATGSRSVMIARTETIASYSEGSIEAYVQSDVVNKVEWIATRDARVRDDHLLLDGVEVDIVNGTTTWIFADGVETRGPGLAPAAHQSINCRCAVAPVVDVDAMAAL